MRIDFTAAVVHGKAAVNFRPSIGHQWKSS